MQPLGTWKNAPLAYVVAEVRFGSLLSLDPIATRLQDLIAETHPRLVKGQAVALSFGEQGVSTQVVPRYQFLSEDSHSGIVLTNDTLSLHTTTYIDSVHFAAELERVWSAWLQARPRTFVERLGLRYWDVLLPEGGLTVDDFFATPLSGVGTLWNERRLTRHTHELVYDVAGAMPHAAVVRMGTVPASQPQPPAFMTVPELTPSERLKRATEVGRASADATVGFVDVDASADIKRMLDVASFVECAKALHESQSAVFKAVTSKQGHAIWRDGVPDA